MSRVVEDESERADMYAKRFTHREDQKRKNLARIAEAKKLLQGGSAGQK